MIELTSEEVQVLRTQHGNRYEARAIRQRLAEAGLKWCALCDRVLPLRRFGRMKTGHYQMACRDHQPKHYPRRTYVPTDGDASRTAEYRDRNLAAVRAAKLDLYERRKAAGMTGRQAAYMEPSEEFPRESYSTYDPRRPS